MPLRTSQTLIAGIGVAVVLAPAGVQAHVPTPSGDEAVITVRVGGDRISGAITDTGPADAAISGLAGARLGLFAAPGDNAPIAQSWATCTSDADGDCSFVVPDTQVGGANRDARFTVRQLSAPPGWSVTSDLRTFTPTEGYRSTAYRFLTGPQLRAGSTYSSLTDFMYTPATAANFDVADASDGVWQLERDNPSISAHCGLDVAVILDTSSSVGSAMPQLIDAADSFVDALTGTRSRAAAFSFSALSPGTAAGPDHAGLTSISTPEGAAAFKQEYAGWSTSSGTSWDRGLFTPASASEHYDVAVIITDGNPDVYGDPRPVTRSLHSTRFKEIEYGIAAANALKADGTRVIALGVGSDIGLDDISGPIAYDGSNALLADHYALADYGSAGSALRELATSLCRGSVSVVTELVPPGNQGDDVSGAAPVGAGWSVKASSSSAGVTGLPSTATTTADGTGTVAFSFGVAGGVQDAQVRLAPTMPSGYHLVTRAGKNAVCRDLSTGAPVALTTSSGGGFQVPGAATAALSCTVYVTAGPPPGPQPTGGGVTPSSLTTLGRVSAIRDENGSGHIDAGDAISYEFTVTNTSTSPLSNVLVDSPLLGAVVCPRISLEPAASMTCISHAPYVVTAADALAGVADVSAVSRALDGLGGSVSSPLSGVLTSIGGRTTVARTSRERS